MGKRTLDLPAPPVQSICKHCRQIIADEAQVCHHCGKHQYFLRSLKDPTILTSLLSTLLAFLLFGATLWKANEAFQANASAQQALAKVDDARKDILQVSQAVLEISEIIPRSTGYGAGLSKEDGTRLKLQTDFLRKKLEENKSK